MKLRVVILALFSAFLIAFGIIGIMDGQSFLGPVGLFLIPGMIVGFIAYYYDEK